MLHGKVIGAVTATVKHPSFAGWKLLIVQPVGADGVSPDGDPQLAIDSAGAGKGETVIITSDGKQARAMLGNETTPVRWSVIGIEDQDQILADS